MVNDFIRVTFGSIATWVLLAIVFFFIVVHLGVSIVGLLSYRFRGFLGILLHRFGGIVKT